MKTKQKPTTALLAATMLMSFSATNVYAKNINDKTLGSPKPSKPTKPLSNKITQQENYTKQNLIHNHINKTNQN